MLTIEPRRSGSIRRTAMEHPYMTPISSTRRPPSMCSGVASCAGLAMSMPALFTQWRRRPRLSAASAARSCAAHSPTSPGTGRNASPSSPAVSASAASSRSSPATTSPSATSFAEIALPIPIAAPVTTADRAAPMPTSTIDCGDCTCRLAPAVLLGCPRLELERDEGLVTDHPRVVAGFDQVRLARLEVQLRSVLMGHMQPARLHQADVLHLAAVGARDRFDALRPPPAGLERQPRGGGAVRQPDDVDPRLVGRAHLVRRVEVANVQTTHQDHPPLGVQEPNGATL